MLFGPNFTLKLLTTLLTSECIYLPKKREGKEENKGSREGKGKERGGREERSLA